MILGVVALVVAFLQPGTGRTVGYLASTVGVLAIAAAVRALHDNRYGPLRIRVTARIGMTLGVVGSAVMIYSMVVVGGAHFGVALPPDPVTLARLDPAAASTASLPGAPALATSAPTVVAPSRVVAQPAANAASPALHAAPPTDASPLFPTPTSAQAELDQLQIAMAGLRTSLLESHPAGSRWPSQLEVQQQSEGIVVALPTGHNLVEIPTGTHLIYSVSSDGSEFSAVLTGGTFGAVVQYDSASGTATSSLP